jgi:ribosome-associated toxin RatA of RatAB toxin-antitoxin module
VQASFVAPLSLCQAYSFITDYEGAKNIPGVSESKIISQQGNVTQVARVAREQLLLFSIELHSVIQYTQRPKDYAVDFVQLSGDTHYYRGTWRLREQGNNTVFTYQSEVEPNSVFPNWVIEYFIHQRMDERVQTMAQRASAYVPKVSATCP